MTLYHFGKGLVITLSIVIVVLLGALIFVRPAVGPVTMPLVSSDGALTVTEPLPGMIVASPVAVAGSVTGGGWFFEASFPVKVLDGDGTVIGQGPAQAQGNWMTTGTVPFSAEVSFVGARYATGTIVFSKDNPSGDPKRSLELSVPVRFK